ncbi:MAG: hypothetical protein RR951_11415, partial [Ruthenibacterium sp.]
YDLWVMSPTSYRTAPPRDNNARAHTFVALSYNNTDQKACQALLQNSAVNARRIALLYAKRPVLCVARTKKSMQL